MQFNQTTLTAYNKFNNKAQGTLIGNWQEERDIRDVTGVGRTIPGQHLKKNRAEMFTKAPDEIECLKHPRQQDNTNERTLGKKQNEWPTSEGHQYGTGYNRADFLRKQGQKSLKREEFFLKQIEQELNDKQRQEEEEANRREFTTTTKEEFYKKDPILAGNVIGKRIMKTQNDQPIPEDQKDADLLVDQGLAERKQFLTDEQLKKYLPRGESYLTQQPITFWQEKQEDGAFYMSKNNRVNPKKTFALNNDFVKTYSEYSHVKE